MSLQGKNQEALTTLAEAIEFARQTPRNTAEIVALLMERSIVILRSQNSEAALAQIERDKAEFPNIAFFSLEKDILLAKGEYERAIAVLQQAERRGVSKSRLSLGYYHAYLGLGQDEKAWLTLQPRADDIKRNPKLMADLGQIGVRLYQSGRYRSSEAAYEHILLLNPDEPRALNNLGFLLIADHQWERSESLL